MTESSRLILAVPASVAAHRRAQLASGVLQPVGQLAHDLDGHLRKLRDHPEELVFGDRERREFVRRTHRRGPRHVDENRDLADQVIYR